jgi:DNA polymerase
VKPEPAATSALPFLPKRITLPALRGAAADCKGCPLYKNATQTVFGEGRATARIVLVGEQPGNEEDLQGHPFVGPAGRLLDRALADAGIARGDAYVTNVVKHFKWEPRGKRRLHKKPDAREIAACLPWLEKEIELIRPRVLVLLGATAAQALLGRSFRVTVQRGRALSTNLAEHAVATVHPSSILRQRTDEERHREMKRFVADLAVVKRLLEGRGPETPSSS